MIKQIFESDSNGWYHYIVRCGNNFESRSCKNIDIIEQYYTIGVNNKLVAKGDKFPYIDAERTMYSNYQYYEMMSQLSYKDINEYLQWLLFDCGNNYIAEYGIPTDEDIKFWKEILVENDRLTAEERSNIISLLNEYVGE